MDRRAVARAPAAGHRRRALLEGTAALSAYLPLLLMALLALATWWLVRNTPVPDEARPGGPPRGEPDYTMTGFVVQRFDAAGQLRAQIEGERLRHFPLTDLLQIDGPRVRSRDAQGRWIEAQATTAQASADGGEITLHGGARVVRAATGAEPAIEFEGESLRASRREDRVVADRPVRITRGGSVLRADRAVYDHAQGVLTLSGQVRASFTPEPARTAGADAGVPGAAPPARR